MKKILTLLALIIFFSSVDVFAQNACADEGNIVTFTYEGVEYEIVKENKTWIDAAACAVERGGELVRIDNQEEQDAIYAQLLDAGIDINNTIAPDGGGASYVWLGGNDILEEGEWFWDGNNDGVGDQFWQGNYSGGPVNDLYSNWGDEPDNWNNQDAVGIALTEWPLGSGSLGSASQWNDIDHTNTLYFIVELEPTSILESDNKQIDVKVYPNPIVDKLFIETEGAIKTISIVNILGSIRFSNTYSKNFSGELEVKSLLSGIYFLKISFEDGSTNVQKITVK